MGITQGKDMHLTTSALGEERYNTRIMIKNSGQVGVNNNDPKVAFDVIGAIKSLVAQVKDVTWTTGEAALDDCTDDQIGSTSYDPGDDTMKYCSSQAKKWQPMGGGGGHDDLISKTVTCGNMIARKLRASRCKYVNRSSMKYLDELTKLEAP